MFLFFISLNLFTQNRVQEIKIVPPFGSDDDYFVRALLMNGKDMFIGSKKYSNNYGVEHGAIYIFKNSGENWTFDEIIMHPNGIDDNFFGEELSLVENNLYVGAFQYYTGDGELY